MGGSCDFVELCFLVCRRSMRITIRKHRRRGQANKRKTNRHREKRERQRKERQTDTEKTHTE